MLFVDILSHNKNATHNRDVSLLRKERSILKNTMFVRTNDVAEDLDVSIPFAYKSIREMNAELKEQGYMTVAGRISRKFYEEKFYGISREDERS